jgi:hypothetical protein
MSRVPLLNDVGAGLKLFLRGKVPLLPERWRTATARQIFERSRFET